MSEIGAVGGDGRGYDDGAYDYEPSAPIREAGAPVDDARGDKRKNVDLARGAAGHAVGARPPRPAPPPKPPEPELSEPAWTPSGFCDMALNALAVATHNPQIVDAIGEGALP